MDCDSKTHPSELSLLADPDGRTGERDNFVYADLLPG